jgi:hypothetical protein
MNTPARTTSTTAILSIVFGVMCWSVFPFVGAIAAVICGHAARKEIRLAPGLHEGDGLAIAGMILGYAQLALIALAVAVVMTFLGGLAAFGWHAG